jgi:predicted transcriptional regulator
MLTPQDWMAACDAAAEDILARAGVTAPPVDALEIARRLRIELAGDASQAGRARLQRLSGQPTIFLRPGDRPERVQWAAAHELGEHFAERVVSQLGLSPAELLPRQREDLASQVANRLLLPDRWFEAACRALAGDLHRLKVRFGTASHELIAWRMLDQPGDRVVTIVDDARVSRRRCNFAPRSPKPLPIEIDTWQRAAASGQPAAASLFGGEVRAWPVHEPDWKREIAVTELDAERWHDLAAESMDAQ